MLENEYSTAVVPDSCTLIYASLDESLHNDDRLFIRYSRDMMSFIKEHGIGIVSEDIIESTAKTKVTYTMTEEEKRNFTDVVHGLRHVSFSHREIESNMKEINRVYRTCRKHYTSALRDVLDSSEDIRRSRRKGVLSKRKMKRWSRNVAARLENDPAYTILRKKLFLEPPGSDDKYLLSLGCLLKDSYENVFIATRDSHMCQLLSGREKRLRFIIPRTIERRLGVKCLQPVFIRGRIEEIMEERGILRPPEGA